MICVGRVYLPENRSLAAACCKETIRSGNSYRSMTGSNVSDKSCAPCRCSGCKLPAGGSISERIPALQRSEPAAVAAAVVVAAEMTTAVSADTPLSGSRVDIVTRSRIADDVGRENASVARDAIAGFADGIVAAVAAVDVAAETSRGSICRAPLRSRYETATALPRRSQRCIDDNGRTF